jgi:hypothetical protein
MPVPRRRARWLLWWALAEHVASRTSAPGTDVSLSDARIERAFTRSAIGRAADWLLTIAGRAWLDSRVHRAIVPLHREWSALDRAGAIRAAGAVVAVAAAVSVVLQALEPTPIGPLSWLLPAVCAAAAVLAMAMAPAIARALESQGP